ncbi:MAG TPA: CDP-alcohol phosphatidyltransferase family protein [Candidatus Nanoarchaeia archaeon]|nr:CDP-alcohol phosphatidyltransferase family protein [Candidatus Nanoarchaeia archaeon]
MSWQNRILFFCLALLLFLVGSIWQGNAIFAMVLFVIILASRVLERFIAAQKKNPTRMGSFLEPLADKIIVYSILFAFLIQKQFGVFPFLVFLLREGVVNFFRFVATKNEILLPKDIFGKEAPLYALCFLFFLSRLFSHPLLLQALSLVTALLVIFALFSLALTGGKLWKDLRVTKRKKKALPLKNLIILANKKSRGYHDRYRRRLLRIFAKRRSARLFFLEPQKNIFAGFQKKLSDAKYIIIAGGDGSFESALNQPKFHKKTLGFFPLGAGNAFYSYFYRGKRFEYLRSRFPFQEEELDVLEAVWEKGRRETLFLSVGLDAEPIRFAKKRTQQGAWDYLQASWKAWWKGQASFNLRCTVDGKTVYWKNSVNITVGKVPYYGYAARSLLGKIPPHDGQVYGLACVNTHAPISNKPIRLWGLLLTALGVEKPPLLAFHGQEIVVKCKKPFPLQAGGEFLGWSRSLRIRVKRKQKVLMI